MIYAQQIQNLHLNGIMKRMVRYCHQWLHEEVIKKFGGNAKFAVTIGNQKLITETREEVVQNAPKGKLSNQICV